MSYIHHIPGRIRIRIDALKRNSVRARALEKWLQSRNGVDRVEINTLTGSVLVHYRPACTSGDALMAAMRDAGWLTYTAPRKPAVVVPKGMKRTVAKAIVSYLAEAALERSVVALAAAIL
jgi:Heavy metal associated domain 2